VSKLLQRLTDASRSGVYRTSRTDEIVQATLGSALHVARIDLAGALEKQAVIGRIAKALAFPAWFGGNWDALEDCLSDLSWMTAGGHVLLIEGSADLPLVERGTLVDILASAAASWAERKRPFFAVILDGTPALPELYNDRR
jgi:hypothetical protein